MKVFGYYQYFVPPIVSAVAKYIHILILKIMVNLSTPLYCPKESIINQFEIKAS
jgi:hypothetical protein